MGFYADNLAEFSSNKNDRKLGDVLAGRFSDMDVDSVEEVRKLKQ